MSQQTMANELAGQTPVNYMFALTLIDRAWRDIQRRRYWSFLFGDAAIPTINPVVAGTVTTALGSNLVVGTAAAATAWAAIPLTTPMGTLQFRVGSGTIYNVLSFDGNFTLTLDRIFVDPGAGAGQGYALSSIYFNGPTSDFLWWDEFLDPVTGYTLSTETTRIEVNDQDPQRLNLAIPAAVIPYQVNPNPGAFFRFPMYEMWPAPAGLTYIGKYLRKGTGFSSVTDSVIYPLDEDVVIELGKTYAYEWCEANKDKLEVNQRGGDFRFLMGKCDKRYKELIRDYEQVDETYSHRNIIAYVDKGGISSLPWVSQKQMQGSFPD